MVELLACPLRPPTSLTFSVDEQVTQLPDDDTNSITRKEMMARLVVCMGGRAAEERIYGIDGVTSGTFPVPSCPTPTTHHPHHPHHLHCAYPSLTRRRL